MFKASIKFTMSFYEAQGRGCLCLWGRREVWGLAEQRKALWGRRDGAATGLLETGGDHISVPKFRINIFQVPLEAAAFQPLPQLHSALDAAGRKCCRDTMEIMKVRPNALKREAGRNQTDMHRQQTQEHQQLYFLLSSA